MTHAERTGLAMLRSGMSWADASAMTGVPVARLEELWDRQKKAA